MTSVKYRSLFLLNKAKVNPKLHDIPALKASLRRWGFVLPLVEDEATETLVAGHGRLQALLEMREDGEDAPRRVKVVGDEWFVPVLSGVAFRTAEEAEAYLLADNRLVELGGWKTDELVEMVKDLQDRGVPTLGWAPDDMQKLLADASSPEAVSDTIDEMTIKQLVLFYPTEQFVDVVAKMQRVMETTGLDNHTAVFLHLLAKHEENRREPDAN